MKPTSGKKYAGEEPTTEFSIFLPVTRLPGTTNLPKRLICAADADAGMS
jgi:hypothetical protein